MKLAGKGALVTGGGSGIGRAICLAFAQEGADVAVLDLNAAGAAKVTGEVKERGRRAVALPADITQAEQVQAAVQRALAELGQLDILVNNAGWDKIAPFLQTDEALWNKLIAINLLGPIRVTRAVLDHMVERKTGKIVNVASDAGRVGSMGEAVYAAAKGGVIAFTKTLARELARYQINVNCVCPGITETPLLEGIKADSPMGQRIIEAIIQATPLRRAAQPEEIAAAVLFLASDDASFITGQTLSVSGGLTMS